MKKTLVALAALAATASFAQSAVTISGVWDAGYKNTTAQDPAASRAEFAGNNQGTSRIIFSGVEDLGGGLKAEFKGQALFSAVASTTGNASTPFNTGNMLFNDELWLGMSGGFGSFKIGTPDSVMHVQAARSQPFGTNMGSGWAGAGNISRFGAGANATLGANGYVANAAANGRLVRYSNSVRYDSPNFNGFGLQVNYVAKNDNAAANSASNNPGVVEYALSYSNGPLNAAFAQSTISVGTNTFPTATTAAGVVTTSPMIPNSQAVYTFLAANYTLGNTTIYAGATTAKTDGITTNPLDTSSTNVALKYALTPSVDLQANVVSVKDKLSSKDQFLNAAGAYYKFSKRTTAYLVLENFNTDISATNNGVNTYGLGVLHTF